jgi:hypothetical protein
MLLNMQVSNEAVANAAKKHKSPVTIEEIARLMEKLNPLSIPVNVRLTEDVIVSNAPSLAETKKRQRPMNISSKDIIPISDALAYQNPQHNEISGTIHVCELFYNYYSYDYFGINNSIKDPKVKSKANMVIKFMIEQLPTVYSGKLNNTNLAEVERAQLIIKREEIKACLSMKKPDVGTASWSQWDLTLKLAASVLLTEILLLFEKDIPVVRVQVNTLNSIHIRLCNYNKIKNGLASNVSSLVGNTNNESVSAMSNFLNLFSVGNKK